LNYFASCWLPQNVSFMDRGSGTVVAYFPHMLRLWIHVKKYITSTTDDSSLSLFRFSLFIFYC